MANAPGEPKLMSLQLLEEITNGFSKDRRLGGGAFGDVYLGKHKDGEKIAVKLLKEQVHIEDEKFQKEYHNLASLHHKNVVLLVGSCNETQGKLVQHDGREVFAEYIRRILCFEYMCNGSLDNFIYDESNAANWGTRYAIIKGICEGLEYLHEKLKPPMCHLDLKPANILLDENMSPKIADFGVSRLFLEERTKKTNSAVGTLGYIPPEYIDGCLISVKFDIFSLGVVIIKIMTGRDGYFRSAEMSSQEFVKQVHSDWMNRLQATSAHVHSVQVRKCIEVALSCVDPDRRKRPSIGAIINDLNMTESIIQILYASRNGSESLDHQVCPCLSNETDLLDTCKNKLISYPLRVTDNRGKVHETRITTVGDATSDTSASESVRPRIKIIDCTEGLGEVIMIDAHTSEPWILVGHSNGHVSVWNYQNQTRVMAFHNIGMQGDNMSYVRAAKFIEPLQSFVVGDSIGFIHVYSYVEVDKLQKFSTHTDGVSSLAVHSSKPFVLSASYNGLIKLWNWEAGWKCMQTFKGHLSTVEQVRFNPQTAENNTFASSSKDFTIKMWDVHSPTPIATLDCEHPVHLDYFIPSGGRRYLVTCSLYGNAQIWDLQTNTCIKEIKGLLIVGCNIGVVESIMGRSILLTVSHDHTVAFCDSNTHRYENRVKFNLGEVRGFAYINKIRSLAIGCHDGIAIMEIN